MVASAEPEKQVPGECDKSYDAFDRVLDILDE